MHGAATDLIPVNLVTGFLGVGKTTAIRHLLDRHPRTERWAVLVNEFGEVGVDGALLARDEVVVEEVAGGCLCCVAAPAFTTGLNRLIRRHRPDRILIEPSGLGHPAQVIDTLVGPLYAGVLNLRATLCLMDARHLASPRHLAHPNFQDQIHLADVLVANKLDLYTEAEVAAFTEFAAAQRPRKRLVAMVEHGRLDPAWLDLERGDGRRAAFPEAHAFLVDTAPQGDTSVPDADWLIVEGHGDGYRRAGWLCGPGHVWPAGVLRTLIDGLSVERRKGLLQTDAGWLAINQQQWTTATAPQDRRSRLELIDPAPIDAAEIDAALHRLADGAG